MYYLNNIFMYAYMCGSGIKEELMQNNLCWILKISMQIKQGKIKFTCKAVGPRPVAGGTVEAKEPPGEEARAPAAQLARRRLA